MWIFFFEFLRKISSSSFLVVVFPDFPFKFQFVFFYKFGDATIQVLVFVFFSFFQVRVQIITRFSGPWTSTRDISPGYKIGTLGLTLRSPRKNLKAKDE